jgi:hypothetical protein
VKWNKQNKAPAPTELKCKDRQGQMEKAESTPQSATISVFVWNLDCSSRHKLDESLSLNFQHFLKPRQVARAVVRNKMLDGTHLSTYIHGDI